MELLSILQIPVTAQGEGYVVSQKVIDDNGGRRVELKLRPPDQEEDGEDEEASDGEQEQEDTTDEAVNTDRGDSGGDSP